MKRTLLLICTLLCANVLLAQTEFIVGNLKYKVTSSNPPKVSVGKVDATITTANIPTTVSYEGTTYSVTSIRNDAFSGCSSLTSVTIPNSVTSIGHWGFFYCSSLTSINIPNSVTSIGDEAFGSCSSLTSVTIPNSVTSIGGSAFSNCSSLSSVTIPNSVTSIGNHAFLGCSSLTSIDIPNSVTSIGSSAFYNCSSLTTLNFNAINCNDFNYNSNSNIYPPFYACPISIINIGDSVQRIPAYFAYDLDSLTSITIGNNVDSIGNRAFYSCSSLTSVTIPNSVTSIGDYAFYFCRSLTSVTIPNSVTSIGSYAFRVCSSLTTLNFNAINCNDFNHSYFYNYFPPFGNLPITTINIGDSVQRIPAYFAYDLDSLTSVTIPNSVTSIGYNAFYDCSSLTSITIDMNNIPNLSNIGLNSSLQNLTLGENVTSIGSGAFSSYSFLQNVTCLATTPPTLFSNSFPNPNMATLTVPCGTLEAYSSPTSFWNMFFNGRISENGYDVVANANDNAFGSVAIENNCSTATLTATATSGYSFLNWNDGNTENPRLVSLTSDTTFTANFGVLVVNNDITATICEGQTYTENGFNVSQAGTYTQTLTSYNGGDSIVTLTLTILPSYNIPLTATICQGQVYAENGFNVNEAGVYTQSLQTVNGCDSIITLTLNVNPIYNTELTATICEGTSYTENGFNVNEAGVHTQTLQTINGCDSIITLTLNVTPSYHTNLTATICEGSELSISGFNVSEAGVYTQTHTAVNGCDSIVTLTVTALPAYNTNLTLEICEGVTMNFCGFNVTGGGVYTQTFTAVNGCDSIVTLTVTELPIAHTNLTLEICEGTSLNFSGFNVSEAGTYTQTHNAANGCDSVVTLVVTTYPTFDTTITATINAGETYAEFGFNESEVGTYVQNLQTINGCDSTITLILDVNSSLMDVEEEELSFYPNPTDSKITFSSTIERIEVIDLTGKTILTFSNSREINIESLPAGAYYLRLHQKDKAIMRKVIKE